MPYKNIVYAKLEKRLFDDPRWYMMSEEAQLNYIKFILFAQATYNLIPIEPEAIRKAFKTNQRLKTIEKTIKEIQNNFPSFKKDGNFYYFEGFEEKTNYIRENRGQSQGTPKEGTDKEEDIEKKRKYIDIQNLWNTFANEHGLKTISKITAKRKHGINSRLEEKEFNIYKIFDKIIESDFLTGKNKDGWKVSFDFIFCSPNNYLKIIEGNYDTNKSNGGANPGELASIIARRFNKERN